MLELRDVKNVKGIGFGSYLVVEDEAVPCPMLCELVFRTQDLRN